MNNDEIEEEGILVRKKAIVCSILIVFVLIFTVSCQREEGLKGNEAENTPDFEPIRFEEDHFRDEDSERRDEQRSWDDVDFELEDFSPRDIPLAPGDDFDPSMFELAGGSERDVREPSPVSNNLLQKQFPETIVLRGNLDENKVALTFDDGPDIRFTPMVLDVLDKHDVKATFFMIGVRAMAHQDLVRRIHESGHAIGNHTFWHPNLDRQRPDRLHWELTRTEEVLTNILGFQPRLFRAPYGSLNEELVDMLQALDFTVVGWNVDSLDWKQEGADMIQTNVLSNVDFGSIILMHDGGDWTMDLSGTAEALDTIITKLKADGTEFVTVPELVGIPQAK